MRHRTGKGPPSQSKAVSTFLPPLAPPSRRFSLSSSPSSSSQTNEKHFFHQSKDEKQHFVFPVVWRFAREEQSNAIIPSL